MLFKKLNVSSLFQMILEVYVHKRETSFKVYFKDAEVQGAYWRVPKCYHHIF